MEKIGIIGNGRFGKLWATILKPHFELIICDKKVSNSPNKQWEMLGSCNTIFLCVPISQIEDALVACLHELKATEAKPLIADVASLKLHTKKIFEQHLAPSHEALLTHPMFGPDSVKEAGLAGQKIMVDKFRTSERKYKFWCNLFRTLGLKVVEMDAAEHDRQAARSLGLVHFVGRALQKSGFVPTEIDSLTVTKLHEIVSSVTADSEELFADMQTLNPYIGRVRSSFIAAEQELDAWLNSLAKHD